MREQQLSDESQNLLRRAVLVSFALYFALGLPDGVFGTVWPTLRDSFGRPDSSFGYLLVCLALGYTLCSIGSGSLAERFGVGIVVRNATLAVVVGFVVFALATSWWLLLVAALIMGAGWGLCDAAINAWMALTQRPRQMGLLHAAYGVGATLGPLLATVFIARSNSWREPFVVMTGLVVVLVLAITKARDGYDGAQTTAEVAAAPALARSPLILTLLVVWFTVYVGVEVTVGQWSYTFLTESRGYGEALAAVLVAMFWGGLTVGRILLAVVGDRFTPERVMAVAIVSTFVEVVYLWVDVAASGAFVLPFIGLSLAAMFPLAIGRTAVYLGPELAAKAVGYQVAASSLGFVTLPFLVGVLADHWGTVVLVPVTLLATLVLGALWALIQLSLANVVKEK